MVYRSCVRSAMLYRSETWCLRENEMVILSRTEAAIVKSMCGMKLVLVAYLSSYHEKAIKALCELA